MILVTLGTQDKPFDRLLSSIEKDIKEGKIKDKVIVQAGNTIYKSEHMEIFDFINHDEFEDLINKCDILITHGGVGNILSGVKKGKKVIAYPRLSKYKEHINDHQLQIIDIYSEKGYIIKGNINNISKDISIAKKFKPQKYENNNKIIDIIWDFINKE